MKAYQDKDGADVTEGPAVRAPTVTPAYPSVRTMQIFSAIARGETMFRCMPNIRQVEGLPVRFQQLWYCEVTHLSEWRDVPMVPANTPNPCPA